MVVEFSVANFRSIKDIQTISFVATGLKSPEDRAEVDANNIATDGGMRLLKTIGIYGPNGSGKSNLVKAFVCFLQAIKGQASPDSTLSSLCDPYLYQDNAADTPSFFQITVIINDKKYRYGLMVKRNTALRKDLSSMHSAEIIESEWLFGTKGKNSGVYFTRKLMDISKETLPGNEKIPPLQYEHSLFLTHAAAFDSEGICAKIRNYLYLSTIYDLTGAMTNFRMLSLHFIDDPNQKNRLLGFLASFNIRYTDIMVERDQNRVSEFDISKDKFYLTKQFMSSSQTPVTVNLNLLTHESSGTQKLFDIASLLLIAFDVPKGVLIILDEVDSNFHPALLIKLIGLFNDPSINKNNSQLLFTSHDTNLLSPDLMRRDQFYFTEKRDDYATKIYSLADLKGIRNDADFAKDYLKGYYGALPVLENYLQTE